MLTASAGEAVGVVASHAVAATHTPKTAPPEPLDAQSAAYAVGGVTACTVIETGENPGTVIRAPAPLCCCHGATARTSAPAEHSALRSS